MTYSLNAQPLFSFWYADTLCCLPDGKVNNWVIHIKAIIQLEGNLKRIGKKQSEKMQTRQRVSPLSPPDSMENDADVFEKWSGGNVVNDTTQALSKRPQNFLSPAFGS